MESKITRQVSANVAKILQTRHLTNRELSIKTGVDESTLGKIINKSQCLTLTTLEKIANGLNMTVVDLITYPVIYRPDESSDREHVTVMIEVTPENKERLFDYINSKI